MDTFEWNKSKEDLLKEMCLALSDVFEETDYTIVRNPTHGEKMNNIYLRGNNKRVPTLTLLSLILNVSMERL